jgi:hypothetical protein
MKNLNITIISTITALAFSLSLSAHDPSMHVNKEAKKADCTAFNKMQDAGTKIDMNDPVMLAMMKKCKNQKTEALHGDESIEKKASDHAKKGEMKYGDSMKKDMKTAKDKNEHNH